MRYAVMVRVSGTSVNDLYIPVVREIIRTSRDFLYTPDWFCAKTNFKYKLFDSREEAEAIRDELLHDTGHDLWVEAQERANDLKLAYEKSIRAATGTW